MPEDEVTLPLHCAYCHGEVTVQLADWGQGLPPAALSYVCPYCERQNRLKAPGRLLWVVKGHAAPGQA